MSRPPEVRLPCASYCISSASRASCCSLSPMTVTMTVAPTAAVPEPDGWEAGAYGIRTPILTKSRLLAPEELDLVLVPCTAFDAACRRVGMGKGYYDRYLPRCTRAVKIGIALEVQRVPRAAVDAHDQRLDAFVTERGIYTWK